MNFEILSLILDMAVLAALGVTIYFAFRLSKGLNTFRNTRKDLQGLMNTLSQNITDAENAIKNLKAESFETADEIRKLIRESRMLSEELQLMNQSGNSLASRLEGLAEKARGSTSKKQSAANIVEPDEWLDDTFDDEMDYAEEADSPFLIQDREFDDEDENGDGLGSEAEREFYKILQEKKKTGRK